MAQNVVDESFVLSMRLEGGDDESFIIHKNTNQLYHCTSATQSRIEWFVRQDIENCVTFQARE